MIDKETYKYIAEKLQPVLPVSWNKVCLYAEIQEKSYEIFFYCFVNGQAKPIQCYDLPKIYDIEENKIDAVFEEINLVLNNVWKNSEGKDKKFWSNFTFVLESTGKFNAYYDYTDLSEGSYEYKKVWKEKYLK